MRVTTRALMEEKQDIHRKINKEEEEEEERESRSKNLKET